MNATFKNRSSRWIAPSMVGAIIVFSGYMYWATSAHVQPVQKDVNDMPLGGLAYPNESFDCYQTDYLRYTSYILHFKTPSFIEKNREYILVEKPARTIDWRVQNIMSDVHQGLQEIPYNPDQPYQNYIFKTSNPLVEIEALVGNNQETYVRVISRPSLSE